MTVERELVNVFGRPRLASMRPTGGTETRLALAVTEIIKDRKLRQVEATKVPGIPQSVGLLALMNYRPDGLSVNEGAR